MRIYESIDQLIGNTPLLRCKNLEKYCEVRGNILAKLESMNPAGSAKDRVARKMILEAEKAGKILPGDTIIEPTSGNTGVGLASIGAAKGYKVILTMPENMSKERQLLLKAYGAEVILTPKEEGMAGAIRKAEELSKEIPNAYLAGQFENPANPAAHYETTGTEIWNDTDGKVDVFVSAAGTGGTVTGVARFLKEKNPKIEIVAVEPAASPVLSGGKAGPHGIQGIGAGFIPKVLDESLLDRIITVTEEESYKASRLMAQKEGVFVGISSGAALHAALTLAKDERYARKNIVVLLPDTGERYLSTPLLD